MTSNESDSDVMTLRRLNQEYPDWRVWRSYDKYGRPMGWVASNKREDCWCAPTLYEDTAAQLEAQLKAPPKGYGRPMPGMKEWP